MTRIVAVLAAIAGLALGSALPVEGAGNFVTVPAKKGKCKKGWTKKTIKRKGKKVKVCVKRRTQGQTTTTQTQTTTTTTTTTTTDTTTNPKTVNTTTLPPQATSTRDDAGAQTALQNAFAAFQGGPIPLERYVSGGSVTMTIHRIWFWPDGQYKFAAVDWNSVSGEICSQVDNGTWTFKEGYRITLADGRTGTLVKMTIALNDGRVGDDIVGALDSEPSYVYVGPNLNQFQVNENMLNGC